MIVTIPHIIIPILAAIYLAALNVIMFWILRLLYRENKAKFYLAMYVVWIVAQVLVYVLAFRLLTFTVN